MYSDAENKKAISDGTFIFNEVYDVRISENVFEHKHFANPFLAETPYLIERKDDKAIVMRWMMGMDMRVQRKQAKAIQTSDDAVLPEEKGLKFIKTVKASEKIMKNEGVSFVYGCYYPGTAMEIAKKLGEINVVNLYAATLPLNDKTYKWKRFDFPLSKSIIKIRSSHLLKKINKYANLFDGDVEIFKKLPFTDTDYSLINSDKSLRVSRSDAYYNWKLALKNKDNILYVTARKDGQLVGFAIVEKGRYKDTIIDWDVYSPEKVPVIASLVLKFCDNKSIVVPSLNPENGEMTLFKTIGFYDARLTEAPVCICAKIFDESVSDIVYEAKQWKHRLIDADYYLN